MTMQLWLTVMGLYFGLTYSISIFLRGIRSQPVNSVQIMMCSIGWTMFITNQFLL